MGNRCQGVSRLQQLQHFIKQAALRNVGQQLLRLHQRPGRLGVQLKPQGVQLGSKTHGANDPNRVFTVARSSVPNHAQRFVFGILQTTVVVHHQFGLGVVVHGVDGEVTSNRVFFLWAPNVVAQDAPGGIHRVLHSSELALTGFFIAAHLLSSGVV